MHIADRSEVETHPAFGWPIGLQVQVASKVAGKPCEWFSGEIYRSHSDGTCDVRSPYEDTNAKDVEFWEDIHLQRDTIATRSDMRGQFCVGMSDVEVWSRSKEKWERAKIFKCHKDGSYDVRFPKNPDGSYDTKTDQEFGKNMRWTSNTVYDVEVWSRSKSMWEKAKILNVCEEGFYDVSYPDGTTKKKLKFGELMRWTRDRNKFPSGTVVEAYRQETSSWEKCTIISCGHQSSESDEIYYIVCPSAIFDALDSE